MNELALFAGGGGGLLGSCLLGWTTVCAVEIDPYCRSILLARQRDGMLPRFPVWDDVRTFGGSPWRGHVDVVSGGFPCTDISAAGGRRGLRGPSSKLWFEMLRIVGEVRPPWVFIENSPHLRVRGLGTVLEGLAGLGYDAAWGCVSARETGALHIRSRMWVVAYADGNGERAGSPGAEVAAAAEVAGGGSGLTDLGKPPDANAAEPRKYERGENTTQVPGFAHWWPVDLLAGVDDGVAYRVDRARATGNGQVARVAVLAWSLLSAVAEEEESQGHGLV